MRFKLSTFVGAAAILGFSSSSASAQSFQGNLGGAPYVCGLNIFVGMNATKCAGFYDGNEITGAVTAAGVDAFSAAKLNISGLPLNTAILEKKDSWDGLASFSTKMYGTTVVGMHWGNYSGIPASDDKKANKGNVSAFYVFEFSTSGGGIFDFDLKPEFLQGISNAAIYKTGSCTLNCGGSSQNIVPEPSTYALMAAGLAGLGLVARRRRNTTV